MEEILNRLDGRLNQAEKLKRNFLYKELKWTLDEAFSQAACGKGKERHVATQDQAFVDQPILVITRMVGPGFPLGQALKKAQESMRLPTTEAKVKELLGAINYLAAAIIYYKEIQANEEVD